MMHSTVSRRIAGAIAFSTAAATVGGASAGSVHGYYLEGMMPSVIIGDSTTASHAPFIETLELNLVAGDLVGARIDQLAELGDDHDGEGASAPNLSSIEFARRALTSTAFDAPVFSVGLTDAGNAVAEFEEEGSFGQIVFMPNGDVEAYFAPPRKESVLLEGSLQNENFRSAFFDAFGFTLAA